MLLLQRNRIQSLPDLLPEAVVHVREQRYGPLLQNARRRSQPGHDVLDQPGSFVRFHDPLVQHPSLRKIIIVPAVDSLCDPAKWQTWSQSPSSLIVLGTVEGIGMVIGGAALAVEGTPAVPVVVVDAEGTVHWKLGVVGTQSVTLSVAVSEEAPLEHSVW